MKRSSADEDGNKTAGRPRDEKASQSILKAAMELGMELGFHGLTIEGIAARARVGKSTIYRRWPDVWSVVAEAVFADAARISPVQERATARESFRVSMRLVARSFRGQFGEILRPLIGRAQVDKTLRLALAERWLSARREISRKIVRRGIASGELRAGLDPDIVLDALYGPLYHRLLLPYDGDAVRLSDAYIDALVDTVFSGLEQGEAEI